MVRSGLMRTVGNIAVSVAGILAMVGATTGCGSADPAPAQPPQLNAHCDDHGATARVSGGRTVYCAQVQGTGTYVWAYTRGPLAHDPNARKYTCDDKGCTNPDGSTVPDYQRCGLLCGEPPTSGDVQSGFADCFTAGTPFEECERRLQTGR
ncbi:hypothetical protein AB0L57_10435 [Nocardia sp. NPDC052254]|uniref:hypothetical protein n=1 Tax=Nocardia sp. NPDC052254 TaxID=3155681 RepID=UPI00342E4902